MTVKTGIIRPTAAILLAGVLAISVVACGSDSDQSKSTVKKASTKQSKKSKTAASGADQNAEGTVSTVESESVTSTSDPLVGTRVFAAGSPWNTPVTGLPVDPSSARMLELATQRRAVKEVPGRQGIETIVRRVNDGLFINTDAWAPLIVEANGPNSRETRFVCRQSDCGAGPPRVPDTLRIPASTTPDPRYDGWLSVIDRENGVGYDFWRARRQTADLISYQYSKAWSLNGPGFSKPVQVDPLRAVGARGSGLPLFAGVISPAELAGTGVDHALAISVPGLARRNYVQPASVTDGVGSQSALPAGARIRLRANVTAERRAAGLAGERGNSKIKSERRATIEAILQALRQYGAIVVDRAAVPTLYAPKGTSRREIHGGELSWLTLNDFEVVQLPKVYKDPPLSKVDQEGPRTTRETDTTATEESGE